MTITQRVFRSKPAKGPHSELVLFPESPDLGGGCEGSSSPKFVYLGNFRVGLVCNDLIGSNLVVGRPIGLMGSRPVRNTLENMLVLSGLLQVEKAKLVADATRNKTEFKPDTHQRNPNL